MRCRSSWDLPRLLKLKLAANCSAADGMTAPGWRPELTLFRAFRRAQIRSYMGWLPGPGERPKSNNPLYLCLAGFAFLGGFGAAGLALAQAALLVGVDLLGEGGGD